MTKTAAPIKITKLRSAFKKINTLGHISHMLNHRSASAPTAAETSAGPAVVAQGASEAVSDGLLTVYVGKTRRVYQVEPELLDHPIMQELVDRSNGPNEILVACEVVLFDHLRWMIQNSDPQLERLDELVEFYSND